MKSYSRNHTNKFLKLGINKKTITSLNYLNFISPTPIQKKVIPLALNGENIIGIAQTGTGKTLAYGLPMIENIMNNHGKGLVVVPTRELAAQVTDSLTKVGKSWGLRCVSIIGGVSQKKQIINLKKKPHIIIATPGRLLDLVNQKELDLNLISVLTLDEADRMLDEGFLPEITKILENSKSVKQKLLFSATMPKSITNLINKFITNSKKIEISPQGTTPQKLNHEVFFIPKNNKVQLLKIILEQYPNDSVLVFTRTKYGAKKLAKNIRNMGHTATEIHSNRTQAQRKTALKGFADWKFRILVATDIASRGIDIADIGLVVNFDLPDQLDDYVHRVGRTGRAGKDGKAISFILPPQKSSIKKIEKLIGATLTISHSKYSLDEQIDDLNQFGRKKRNKRKFHSKKKYFKKNIR
tara:strand:- start:4349 stop:5581 length:1233 start_codon:yes stop_codon:yes gene_type:complete